MARRREWDALEPGAAYVCSPREASLLGVVVPGRGGGVVSGCATPSKKHPRQGQVIVGLPLIGDRMRRAVARGRVRDATRGRPVVDDPLEVSAAVARQRRGGALPEPTGLPYPHRRGGSPCDAAHPLWSGYPDDLESARERAASRAGEDDDFDAVTRDDLDRAAPQYGAAVRACVRQLDALERTRAGKAVESTARTAGRRRASALARGEDVTAADYRDLLAPATRRAKR